MKTIVGLFAAAALVGLATSAAAQPPGSYRDSCRDIRMQGSVLTALCRRAGGRGEQLTALNVANCVGDIGNNNGNLVCNGGQPARPVSPPPSAGYPGYPAQGYYGSQPGSGYPSAPGFPTQGYGPQPGSGYPPGPGYPAQGYYGSQPGSGYPPGPGYYGR